MEILTIGKAMDPHDIPVNVVMIWEKICRPTMVSDTVRYTKEMLNVIRPTTSRHSI